MSFGTPAPACMISRWTNSVDWGMGCAPRSRLTMALRVPALSPVVCSRHCHSSRSVGPQISAGDSPAGQGHLAKQVGGRQPVCPLGPILPHGECLCERGASDCTLSGVPGVCFWASLQLSASLPCSSSPLDEYLVFVLDPPACLSEQRQLTSPRYPLLSPGFLWDTVSKR